MHPPESLTRHVLTARVGGFSARPGLRRQAWSREPQPPALAALRCAGRGTTLVAGMAEATAFARMACSTATRCPGSGVTAGVGKD